MEQMNFESPEQVLKSMNTGDKQKDLEVINAVLSGSYQINTNVEPVQPEQKEESVVVEKTDETVPEVNIALEEAERQKKYIEMIEARRRDEREQYLREVKIKEDEVALEKKYREDLEKRIREIESRKQNVADSSQQDNTDIEDEYTSEYNKKTRVMVEELKNDLTNNPSFTQLYDRINKIESTFESETEQRKKQQEQKEQEEKNEKLFNNIRKFMSEKAEFKTQKDIKKMDEEYQNFRKDIAYITNSKSSDELELAIYEYRKNGRTKELADKNGITAPVDFEKYEAIADLVDFKNGYEFDPVLGKRIPILDENGVQIRYRSLDEAYNIKNYSSNISNVKREAFKEVGAKLEQFNNAPVTLKHDMTSSFNEKFTVDQARDLINSDPREWVNNPEKLKLVKQAYSDLGLEMPKYRGRKF